MKILLVDNGTSLLEKLKTLIPGAEIVKKWYEISESDCDSFDIIILSGSKDYSVVWQRDDFKKEVNLILNTNKPVIGICFGCELIAFAFGGVLSPKIRTKGITNINILDERLSDKLQVSVYENHRWVISSLPKDFVVMAESGGVPEIIRSQTRPIYGLQFHPENMVDETEGDDLFKSLLMIIKNESYSTR